MDVDQIEEYVEDDNYSVGASSPEQYVHTYLPLLVEESLFETEKYTSEYESEYELSDEIEPEEQDREEEQESTANLPENPWHRVIAIFTVMFISTFIVDDGAVILITDCHTLYDYSNTTQTYCNFRRVGSKTFCGNNLYKHSIRNTMISKHMFIYNSLTASLKKLFMCPSFKKNINQLNRKPKVDGTLFDVYDGKMWKEFVDDEGAHAIYLTVNNLSREERNNVKNVILVGLMPGPKEASTEEISNYLRPLVDELIVLYKGITVNTYDCPGALIHAALLIVACNIPTTRKTCGFTSHNSTCVCNKCNRHFKRIDGSTIVNYSGFKFSDWVSRTKEENIEHVIMWKNARTLAERKQLEVENGVLRATVIDPMHNLFLGMAKRMMDNWIACGLLDNNDLAEMQKEADSMTLPMGYTIFQTKIGKGFSFMKTRLPSNLLVNWIHFVDACRVLTKPAITEEEIAKAHVSLRKFCCGCETMYKLDLLLPNMHLYLHLKESIQDFGPIYSFWLFSFECFNGVLKGFQTNQKSGFEKTYMKKFIKNSSKAQFHLAIIKTCHNSFIFHHSWNPPPIQNNKHLFYKIEYDDETLCSAKTMLRHRIFVNDRIQKIASINLLGQVYKGGEGLIMRGSYIQAKYMETNNNSKGIYAGHIKYLFTYNFTPNPIYTNFHACIELYDATLLKYDYDNILPVYRILSPIAIGSHVSGSGAAKVIVIPLPRKLYA
ncbi:hypothetical protein PHYBLDRAFT_142948 [Phycomyces blakesleeanus NRRL 1555(-)]|uniref:Transposase domain-containing protein n=1 Tax=Phycomyces blakesleeanus (strain ATCC 8743b / DSM 1359 / FGSC 10004 / NBRC 33097 / NRRL 1555) TaxID=763407 RepID=A0A162XP87_PHYB8|nr:hypothetical protein PHYBLDRAFT_142948 [Phycomyces blakesleeanus NRRL 1555(-)]OAD75965.1 hypothetical protein PHYBLDRAFT_142948 [Phycomyces blakesleeanus NRRL 1555(-)]|eukprot:XP_018294005.1 hypothetical protein PHYBLDRAFT_142948 [Phycomyces blakesleeanus NRRL 1555(-)]